MNAILDTDFTVLMSGASVILDFGCWSPGERYAIRVIAGLARASFALEYVEVAETVRRARCDKRWLESPETTFAMSGADHDRFVSLCQPPTADELAYGPVPEPPGLCQTWAQWASQRWPTLPVLDPQPSAVKDTWLPNKVRPSASAHA